MTQLEKILKKREEERLKKEEKERIKAEKKAERERLKKIEHKKKLRKKQNKRAYKKRRAVQLEERRKKHDKFAYYMIVIMKNKKRIKRIGTTWWKTDAYEIYNKAIEENEASVLCPVQIHETTDGIAIDGNLTRDMKYQIMIFEKVRKIICDQFDLEEDDVTPETLLEDDLEADSLDLVDLVMSFEDEFQIEVPDEDVENIKTVGDIVKYIEEH